MGELANCAQCDRVFVKEFRDICADCYKQEEADFKRVYKFLRIRENRMATMGQIVEATGVEESLIQKFVREKRLRAADFPQLSYPCERCERPINEGTLCDGCQQQLKKDLTKHEEAEAIKEQMTEAKREQTYYTKGEGNKD